MQYTIDFFPKNLPNPTVCEKKNIDIKIPSSNFSMFNTHSTVRLLFLLNPENVFSFNIFTDGFCLSEFEFLKHISR